jgi:hypothetical protein
MKKALSLVLAAASILSVSTSALALDVGDDDEPTFVDGVLVSKTDIFAEPGYSPIFCGYRLRQTNIYNPLQGANCSIKELLPADEASCGHVLNEDVETTILAGEKFDTKCYVLDAYNNILKVALAAWHEDDDGDRIEGEFFDKYWEQHSFDMAD